MMSYEPTVFIVDDDVQARKSVSALIRSMGLKAEEFASAEEFLATYAAGRPGCLVTDLRMLGMSGLELQEQLARRRIPLPVILLTAYARTQTTVRAVQAGAVTVLDKPYADNDLWDAIRAALTRDAESRAQHERREAIRAILGQFSLEERVVLDMVMAGRPNKLIAKELDISLRTVENRRRGIFHRMNADSLPDLVRMVLEVQEEG